MTGPADALDRVAAEVAAASPSGGAGVVAGGVVALAAALCEAVARGSLGSWPDGRGAAVQSAELRRRAGAAAAENGTAYTAARAALERMPTGTGRDAALRAALVRAADAPLLIATIAADCTALAAAIARGCDATLRADAVAAAELAAATAQSAAGLVEVNLALLPGDERRERARDTVRAAEAARAHARAALDAH